MKVTKIETNYDLLYEVLSVIKVCLENGESVVIPRRPDYTSYSVNDYITTGLVREVVPLVSKNYTLHSTDKETGKLVMLSELVPTNAGLHLYNIIQAMKLANLEDTIQCMSEPLDGMA